MISDTLWNALQEIEQYESSPTFANVYSVDFRQRLAPVKESMRALARELDRVSAE